MKQGIFVRYFDTPYLQNYLRISIGRAKDRKVLIEALRNIEVVE
jgi:histidinol-phosphate/aromatic aminotransferase/cobyric acid decarboxylase-like protein